MAQREAEQLRRELDAVTSRHGKCFPRALVERAGQWLAERRAEGARVAELAEQLGIGQNAVRRWSAGRSATAARAMVTVEIVPDSVAERTVSVVSPAGFRIDGLLRRGV